MQRQTGRSLHPSGLLGYLLIFSISAVAEHVRLDLAGLFRKISLVPACSESNLTEAWPGEMMEIKENRPAGHQ